MAVVMIAGASADGADVDVTVIRAVASATVGPFLVAAMGFAALLASGGLLTLRTGLLARWIGVAALVGALAFVITFLTLLAGPGEDSVFGYGFFVGFVTLAIWSIAMSLARYRALAAGELVPPDTDSRPVLVPTHHSLRRSSREQRQGAAKSRHRR
jgi:hypothetical protein